MNGQNQRPPGLYLKPPHGELSFTGAKRALAKAREFGFEGQPFTLCSGPFAYGELLLGDPEAVGVEDFDARFGEHRVSVKEREKWWPEERELYLYAYKEWRPFDRPQAIKVPPMVQTMMGPVDFIEEADMGQGVVINISNATPVSVPEDYKLLKAMAGDGGAIAELEGEEKIWKPSDAESHTHEADTPEKRNQWAGTANGARKTCLGKIEGTPTAAQVKACEASAIRIANAAVKGTKEIQDMREGEKELALDEISSLIWRALEPPQTAQPTVLSDDKYPRDMRVYNDHVDYRLGEQFLRRKYKVTKKGELELDDPVELVLQEKAEAQDEDPSEDDKAEGARDKTKTAQAARAKKYGIVVKDGGNVTKPGEWASVPDSEWLDPVNYRYPCPDAKQTRAAAAYWGKPKNRSQYSSAEQGKMDSRLASFKKKFDISQPEEKTAMESLKEQAEKALEAIAGLWKSITGDGAEQVALEGETGFKAFKAEDGTAYVLTWTTNAFLDRDGEIFSTAAIEEYADRAWKEIKETGSKGQLDFYHAPGSEFADIVWAGAVGRFLVELSTFNGDEVGQTFQKYFLECPEAQKELAPDGWKASHRFKFRPLDKADGVYEWFDKDRTSVLAAGRAANPYTAVEVIKMLNDEQKDVLTKVGEATGVDLLGLVSKAEGETKRLEDANVAHKEVGAAPSAEATATVPPAKADATADEQVEAIAKRVLALMGVEELGKMLQGLAEQQKAIMGRLDEVEKGDLERIKEKESWRPNMPWFRASKADSTILDDTKDKDLKGKEPTVPKAIQRMTDRLLGQPPMAGGSA